MIQFPELKGFLVHDKRLAGLFYVCRPFLELLEFFDGICEAFLISEYAHFFRHEHPKRIANLGITLLAPGFKIARELTENVLPCILGDIARIFRVMQIGCQPFSHDLAHRDQLQEGVRTQAIVTVQAGRGELPTSV